VTALFDSQDQDIEFVGFYTPRPLRLYDRFTARRFIHLPLTEPQRYVEIKSDDPVARRGIEVGDRRLLARCGPCGAVARASAVFLETNECDLTFFLDLSKGCASDA
jgi:hypothetical protein